MLCKIQIAGDQMCVMDEGGNTYAAATLASYRDAKRQIQGWAATYTINVADAYDQLGDHFSAKRNTKTERATEACGAIDQAAFEDAIRENMSPEGVAALIMALQPAGSIQASTPEGEQAIQQVIWFRNTLLEMIGVKAFNQTMNELGF